MKHRIVVLGAGYAGAFAAGSLALRLSPRLLTASAIRWAAWAGVRCVVSTTSASLCSHARAASA